jgi:hypothetical protein
VISWVLLFGDEAKMINPDWLETFEKLYKTNRFVIPAEAGISYY